MSVILLGEYRNQNSNRVYPFADSSTLIDTSGFALPTDFIIDAFLYPIDITGSIYLHSIDTANAKIYFATTDNDEPFAVADYVNTSDTAYVYETGEYERQIGTLVFGSGMAEVLGGDVVRLFTSDTAALCPTAYITMNQAGVRGFLLDDGTLVTGDITLTGGTGLTITSYAPSLGSDNYIIIDMYGTLPATPTECGDPYPFISEICFERLAYSLFAFGSTGSNFIELQGSDFSQEDICNPQRLMSLPDSDGNLPPKAPVDTPCNPLPPPGPPDPGTDDSVCFSVAGFAGGTFYLVAPNGGSYTNPMLVAGVKGDTSPASFVQAHPVSSLDSIANDLARLSDPPSTADGLKISIRGLSSFRGGSK